MTRLRLQRKTFRALANFDLPIPRGLPHNVDMDNETGPPQRPKTVWSWATTPPQSYLVYLIALVLV